MPLFTLNWYNTNNNTKYLFNTTIRYSAHNLFVSVNLYSLDFYNLQTRNRNSRLTEYNCTADRFILPFYSPTRLV